MQTTIYKITNLKPAEHNPRTMAPEQMEHLKRSIEGFGFVEPVVVNTYPGREGVIVGGHQRVKAAAALGLGTVPCVEVSLAPEEERELNVRLNRNLGGWDWDVLRDYFADSDLIDWGFDPLELEVETAPTEEDGANGGDPLGGPVLRFVLVFNDEDEQGRWHGFLKTLRERYPESDTISERLIAFIEANA